jgi:AmiR/NasT family two-component response regulator
LQTSKSATVLIAEDDYLVAKELVRCVKNAGYQVAGQATDGQDAINRTKELRPEVILMDINMPGVDGLQASREIQETCPTPIVIVTAYETPHMLDLASKSGAGAYLTKPVETSSLDRAITIAMARHDDIMKWRRLHAELSTKNEALEKALTEIKTLQGLIPICCQCKKIRDDDGYWSRVESYFSKHKGFTFTHGYCPTCAKAELSKIESWKK